jgi:DNA-binding transcriptional ArsR family regulator
VTLGKVAVDFCHTPEHRPAASQTAGHSAAIEGAARIFRALGDGPRLRLLVHLLGGERCVGDLAALEGEALSTISQRLRVLRTEKIIIRRRKGKHVNYLLADRHIFDLVKNAMIHAEEPPSPRVEEFEKDENDGHEQNESNAG